MKFNFIYLSVLAAFLGTMNNTNAQETLYTENFNYTPGTIPTGWTNTGEQPSEWKVADSQIGGGTAPELYMGPGFQVGLSRLVSPNITVTGHEKLKLSYDQYLINYSGDWGEIVGMDVTYDGGFTWNPIWEKPLGMLNIPQERFHYYLNIPSGTNEIQLAFRFEGNNNAINGWAIDNLKLETVPSSDMIASNVQGINTPILGQDAMVIVDLQNGGSNTQDNYTVKLFSDTDELLATVSGPPLGYSEKTIGFFMFPTTEAHLNIEYVYAIVETEGDEDLENNRSKNFYLNVLPTGTISNSISDGSYPLIHSIPYNFFTLHSLSQTLYPTNKIEAENKTIIGIQYTSHFDEDINDVPVEIYLAETDQENLSSGWLNPSEFTKVYDGLMDFRKGLNTMFIPFDEAFDYTNKNIVVYNNKSHSEMVLWSTFISALNENGEFSRYIEGDTEAFDAMNPPTGYPAFYTPNITFFFSDGQMEVLDQSQLKATVYPNPVSNVLKISLDSNEQMKEIRLINSVGQLVKNQKATGNSTEINVDNLPSGYYLVQILTANDSVTKKILVK